MPADEALGLAQILLGLLLFTVGIPALIIEVRVEEPLRRLLHKRIRPKPMIGVGAVTLVVVAVLILATGVDVGVIVETVLKSVVAALICLFVGIWVYIYKNVSIELVIRDIVGDLNDQLERKGSPADSDLTDLVLFGENLRGGEKNAVVRAIGVLCQKVQSASGYNGTQLEDLLHGLQRVVGRSGSLEHHRSALTVVSRCWKTLVRHDLVADQDAKVLKEVAWSLGSLAVSQQMGATALRWMSSIPRVVDVPYRIGIAAIHEGNYTVAIEALSRLSWIAESRNALPKELIAMVAHFHAAGSSAGRTARDFLERLHSGADEVRRAAGKAASDFRESADYLTADKIEAFLEKSS